MSASNASNSPTEVPSKVRRRRAASIPPKRARTRGSNSRESNLHVSSPFRGSTEFRDGLCGPGSAAWAAETGAPAGVPRPARPPLGIQILGGEFHQMLPGGAVLPAEASQRFSMSHDNQRESHGCRS